MYSLYASKLLSKTDTNVWSEYNYPCFQLLVEHVPLSATKNSPKIILNYYQFFHFVFRNFLQKTTTEHESKLKEMVF